MGVQSAFRNASSNTKTILSMYLLKYSGVPPGLVSKHLKMTGSKFMLAILPAQSDPLLYCPFLFYFSPVMINNSKVVGVFIN